MIKSAIKSDIKNYNLERKIWKHQAGTEIFLLYKKINEPQKGEDFDVRVFLVSETPEGAAKILASGKLTPELETEESWSYPEAKFCLDLAKYQLTDTQTAIGVRFNYILEFPAGQNQSEILYLLRVNSSTFEQVFHAPVAEGDVQRGPDDASSMKATVSISSQKTNSMHDIVLKEKWELKSLLQNEDGEPDLKSKKCKGTKTYKWINNQYSTQDLSCTKKLSDSYSEKMKDLNQILDQENSNEWQNCISDSDCVVVGHICGEAHSVNIKYKSKFMESLGPSPHSCAGSSPDKMYKGLCSNSKCVISKIK
ncbi:MAG: hypothetical protein ACK5W9_06740 [Bdellovibrionales bacterium]